MPRFVIKTTKTHNLSILLSLWVYTYAIFYFIPLIVPFGVISMYIWLTIICAFTILDTNRTSLTLLKFSLLYIIAILLNLLFVSYKYYVAVEAISGAVVFFPAFLIVSSSFFNLENFLYTWRKVAFIATFLSPVVILLVHNKTVGYGVFAFLNLPSTIIFAYSLISDKNHSHKYISLVFAIINFLIILFFGGRMPAFAALSSIFLGYILSPQIKTSNKVYTFIIISIICILLKINTNLVLSYIQTFLIEFNLYSRTFNLIAEQVTGSSDSIYLSDRDYIYNQILYYIKQQLGFPGGFGVALHLTNGHYYHPHNLILQLASIFGIYGSIFFLFMTARRLLYLKKHKLFTEYHFTLLLIGEYSIFSLTNGSMLNNFSSILAIAILFFYKSNINPSYLKNKSTNDC